MTQNHSAKLYYAIVYQDIKRFVFVVRAVGTDKENLQSCWLVYFRQSKSKAASVAIGVGAVLKASFPPLYPQKRPKLILNI